MKNEKAKQQSLAKFWECADMSALWFDATCRVVVKRCHATALHDAAGGARHSVRAAVMVGTPRCGVRTAQRAVPTWKRTFAFHVWLAFVHGSFRNDLVPAAVWMRNFDAFGSAGSTSRMLDRKSTCLNSSNL